MTIKIVQGLRALAALLVVSVHMGNPQGFERRYLHNPHPFTGALANVGYLGVDIFFVISGFIMMVTSVRKNGTSLPAGEFLKRRLIRIYPPLWVINSLLLLVYVMKPALVNSHAAASTDIIASYLLLPQSGVPLLLVAWTLVYEMYFYLIFGLGLLAGARFLWPVLVTWALIIPALQVRFASSANVYLAFVASPIPYEFLVGVVAGVLFLRGVPVRTAVAGGVLGLVALAPLTISIATSHMAFPEDWSRVAIALPLAAVMIGLVVLEQRHGSFTPRFLERLGDASYAMYLWHIPLLTVLGLLLSRVQLQTPMAQLLWVPLAYIAVMITGLLVYMVIERPLIARFRGIRVRRPLS